MPVPKQCDALQNKVNLAKAKLASAQKNLKEMKSQFWAEQVHELSQDLTKAKAKLQACIDKAEGKVPPGPSKPYQGKPFKNPCQTKEGKVESINHELENAKKNLKQTKSSFWKERIKELMKKLAAAKAAYNECIKSHNPQPELSCTITGSAKMTTNWSQAAGPFTNSVQGTIQFHAPFHETISLLSVVPIQILIPSPPAPQQVQVTITLDGVANGSYDPGTGAMSLTLPLAFSYSSGLVSDDKITFFLSTGNSGGKKMDTVGNVTLTGSGTFEEGFLAGNGPGSPSNPTQAKLVLTATIAPHPYVA